MRSQNQTYLQHFLIVVGTIFVVLDTSQSKFWWVLLQTKQKITSRGITIQTYQSGFLIVFWDNQYFCCPRNKVLIAFASIILFDFISTRKVWIEFSANCKRSAFYSGFWLFQPWDLLDNCISCFRINLDYWLHMKLCLNDFLLTWQTVFDFYFTQIKGPLIMIQSIQHSFPTI